MAGRPTPQCWRGSCRRAKLVLEFYICRPGIIAERFHDGLVHACHRGVRVRLLLDAYGSKEVADGFWRALVDASGELRWFNPLRVLRLSFRNHRKLFFADAAAVVGGLNLADEYDGDGVRRGWREVAVIARGTIVEALRHGFDRQWYLAAFTPDAWRRFTRGRVGRPVHADAPALLLAGPGCRSAELRRALRRALAGVARRGVVRVLVPARGDVPLAQFATRHAMRRLAGSGVRFFDYLPQMLHSKLLIIDDIVYVGSANLDTRSRLINFELMLRLPVPALADEARALFERDLAHARSSAAPEGGAWQRWRERAAYFVLARIDPYVA